MRSIKDLTVAELIDGMNNGKMTAQELKALTDGSISFQDGGTVIQIGDDRIRLDKLNVGTTSNTNTNSSSKESPKTPRRSRTSIPAEQWPEIYQQVKHGKRQKDIAEKFGASPAYISKIMKAVTEKETEQQSQVPDPTAQQSQAPVSTTQQSQAPDPTAQQSQAPDPTAQQSQVPDPTMQQSQVSDPTAQSQASAPTTQD